MGGTFQLEVGGGAVYRRHEDGTSKTVGVAAAPSLGIGLKFNKQLGVLLHISALNNDANGSWVSFLPVIQYWPLARLYVSAGLGLSDYYFPDPVQIDGEEALGWHGLGFSARVGYSVLGTDGHRLTVSLEATPAFYPDDTAVGVSLVGGYQYW